MKVQVSNEPAAAAFQIIAIGLERAKVRRLRIHSGNMPTDLFRISADSTIVTDVFLDSVFVDRIGASISGYNELHVDSIGIKNSFSNKGSLLALYGNNVNATNIYFQNCSNNAVLDYIDYPFFRALVDSLVLTDFSMTSCHSNTTMMCHISALESGFLKRPLIEGNTCGPEPLPVVRGIF